MQPFKPGQPSCNLCPCNEHNTSCEREGASNTDLPSHIHIFELPGVATAALPQRCGCKEGKAGQYPCSKAAAFSAQQPFSVGFHTASMNWTTNDEGLSTIVIGVDGAIVNTITSPCLVEEIGMDFDRETMPGWMQLPPPDTLPDQPFEVDYVRSWKKTEVKKLPCTV